MNTGQTSGNSHIPMLIIGSLFSMFGFVTWLNGSLIPFLQIAGELNHMQAYLVTMEFYIAYMVMALPLSLLLPCYLFIVFYALKGHRMRQW